MTFRPPSFSTPENNAWSGGWILECIQVFDRGTGASEWAQDSRKIAFFSAVLLGSIRFVAKEKGNVNWYSFLHACVTGIFSAICVWLNQYSAAGLTGRSEPLGAILCHGPLTTIHAILPAITVGYGIYDVIEGLQHGMDFVLHGFATLTIMAYFCEVGVPEIIVPMLMMEISTINLCLMRATFLNEHLVTINIVCFVVSFFLFRIILCPYLWWGIFSTTWEHRNNPTSQACLPWHFTYVVFGFGMFFNCLNAFWFYKIIRKFHRKLTGREAIKARNSLKED